MVYTLTSEAKDFLSRVEDKVQLVLKRHQEQVTEFADPYLRDVANRYLKNLPDINFASFGGALGAERQRIVICPEYLKPQPEMAKLSIIELTGNFEYVTVSHRDFLGALLGQGIKREKVGDIFLTQQGCVVIISQELAEFLLIDPPKIKGVSLTVSQYKLGQWQPEEPQGKTIFATLASLRLDAIVANGFGVSRTKVVSQIKGGKVKVNWQVIEDTDYQCQENDTISFRGRGRLVISEIGGETRKGRIKIKMIRYK